MFFFPAAAHVEKDGTFTQTQRMLQWHHKAVDPPGDAQSELEFFYLLGQKIRARLAGSTDPRDRPLLDLTWDYPLDEHGEISADAVLQEINGFHLTGDKAGQPLNTFNEMKADGSTAGGCWIYTGVYADGVNQAARRKPGREQSWVAPEWGWAWPMNRRILYNRASADPEGKPWSERKAYVWWDEEQQRWTGHDVPDFEVDQAPVATGRRRAPPAPTACAATTRSSCRPTARAGCTRRPGCSTARCRPTTSRRSPRSATRCTASRPTRPGEVFPRTDNLLNPSGDEPGAEIFPYVFTTYRLTEHHTAGGMSRWQPYLAELQPEFFCEVSPELARERGLEHNGWATIVSARTAIEARVLVTERVVPLRVGGRTVHQVGLPYHWGVGGDAVVTGDSANDLFGVTLDPNVHIQESKVASCDIQPGRRPRGPALLEFVEDYRRRAGITLEIATLTSSSA